MASFSVPYGGKYLPLHPRFRRKIQDWAKSNVANYLSFNTTVSRRSETVCKCRRAIKKHGVKITLYTVYASGPLTLTCSVEACAVLDKDVDWAEGRSKFSSNLL